MEEQSVNEENGVDCEYRAGIYAERRDADGTVIRFAISHLTTREVWAGLRDQMMARGLEVRVSDSKSGGATHELVVRIDMIRYEKDGS